jgi:glycosyltransferase involved in cell wall biosynthesis
MEIARRLDIPLVVTFHGWDARIPTLGGRPTPYERIHMAKRRRMLDQADLVLGVSEWLRGELVALGSAPHKTEVHYLGVDRRLFDGQRAEDGKRRIAMIGRLVRLKGTHFALEAFRRLAGRIPDLAIEIIGGGPEQASLREFARKHDLPVAFLGARSQRDARDLLARSRVLCLPSTASEGLPPEAFGLVSAEAQAMGVPVVATAIGGIHETMEDGRTGILVPDADPASLADALERLLTDDTLHAQMRVASQRLVAEKFDMRTNLAGLAQRYASVLHRLGR